MALQLLEPNVVHNQCRMRIESCELWLRRIIDDKFKSAFGQNYFEDAVVNGRPVFNSRMKSQAKDFCSQSPEQYSRLIDTVLLDNLGTILSHPDIYNTHFEEVFKSNFRYGADHISRVVSIIVPIRNALSHANGASLSLHDLERGFCYCNDLISSVKGYYSAMTSQDKFPAPIFIRYMDSIGTNLHISNARYHFEIKNRSLYEGDELRVEVEVDSSFAPDEYEIKWSVSHMNPLEEGMGKAFNVKLESRHVGQQFGLQVVLKTKKAWHRMQNVDAILTLTYEVLPHPP